MDNWDSMTAARMTFSVPIDTKRRAQAMRDVNWSSVVTRAIEEKIAALELADRIAARSRLTAEDAKELSAIMDDAMAKHFGVKK